MTQSIRKFEIVVSHEHHHQVYQLLHETLNLSPITCFKTHHKRRSHFHCYVAATVVDAVQGALLSIGCGSQFGTVAILPVASLQRPASHAAAAGDLSKKEEEGLPYTAGNIQSRLPIEEVYARVLSMANPGINEGLFLLVAGSVAAFGLVFGSTSTIVAAMLLSPLMDPLVGIIFGAVILDARLSFAGVRSFGLGSLICIVMGFLYGLIFSPFGDDLDWPTPDMLSRGSYTALISGALVAAPSGVAVALCVTVGGANSLVGAAIAASILPPLICAGIMWARAALGSVVSATPDQSSYAIMGGYSFGLWLVNVIVIFGFAYGVFRLKAIIPFQGRASFYEDISAIVKMPQSQRPWNQAGDLSHLIPASRSNRSIPMEHRVEGDVESDLDHHLPTLPLTKSTIVPHRPILHELPVLTSDSDLSENDHVF